MSDALRSTKLREVGDKARELAKLKEHPSWEILRQEYEIIKRAFLEAQVRKQIAGGIDAEPLNQRHVDYKRGFFAGVQTVLDNPDHAQAQLKRLLDSERKEANV